MNEKGQGRKRSWLNPRYIWLARLGNPQRICQDVRCQVRTWDMRNKNAKCKSQERNVTVLRDVTAYSLVDRYHVSEEPAASFFTVGRSFLKLGTRVGACHLTASVAETVRRRNWFALLEHAQCGAPADDTSVACYETGGAHNCAVSPHGGAKPRAPSCEMSPNSFSECVANSQKFVAHLWRARIAVHIITTVLQKVQQWNSSLEILSQVSL
jgi:hypothetical protein